jgi:DNA-binding response OmpR family regulator
MSRLLKVLFVHSDIDEKACSTFLESLAAQEIEDPILSFYCVPTTLQAMEWIQRMEFDLIIVQMDLPELSGKELFHTISPMYPTLPFLFLCDVNQPELLHSIGSGTVPSTYFVDYVVDPFSSNELFVGITRILGRKNILVQFKENAENAATTTTTKTSADETASNAVSSASDFSVSSLPSSLKKISLPVKK